MGGSVRRARNQRGVAAVEAGLLAAFLSPLLLGVLWFGDHFWHQQHKQAYEPRVTQSELVGDFSSCAELLAAVRSTVLANLQHVAPSAAAEAGSVTAEVVDFVPGRVGVEVRLRVTVPRAGSGLAGLSPGAAALVTESLARLDHVRLTSQTC
jgi:hypothetical protein